MKSSAFLLAAAIGLALPLAQPASAQSSDHLPTATAVANFYADRPDPLWLRAPDARDALLEALRAAPLDGFDKGPELAAMIDGVIDRARSGRPGAGRDAERLMSNAFILYAQALKWPGSNRMVYADPALSPRVPTPAEVLQDAAEAPDLAEHVRKTAGINPFYAALKAAAPGDTRFLGEPSRALRASLERTRMLPATGRYVLVDLASQQLLMIEDGRVADRMKVVVGKRDMATPLMAGTLRQVTLNPYWNVPVDLAAKNIAPNVLRHGASWFRGRGYEVLSGFEPDATILDPAAVDWQAVADGRQEARVRQKPSATNMMGAMKFEFPNTLGIYLHDTPDRGLFAFPERAFSSGCVRLEDAARLGRWLMGRAAAATSDRPEQQVALPAGVPVYLTYLTVRPEENGRLAYANDIYGLDELDGAAKVAAAR